MEQPPLTVLGEGHGVHTGIARLMVCVCVCVCVCGVQVTTNGHKAVLGGEAMALARDIFTQVHARGMLSSHPNVPFHPFFSLFQRGLGRLFARGGSEPEGLHPANTQLDAEKCNPHTTLTQPSHNTNHDAR